jgi:hypothetical protein
LADLMGWSALAISNWKMEAYNAKLLGRRHVA